MANLSSDGSQPNPLLITKLYVPAPHPNRMPQTRLIKQLHGGLRLGHRLTFISALAGLP